MPEIWPSGLVVACQAAMAIIFAVAAGSKVWKPSAFRQFCNSLSRTLPIRGRLTSALAATVLLTEAVVALSVTVPALATGAFVLAGVLLVSFTGSTLYTLRQGSREPCFCFGMSAKPAGRLEVLRNLILLAITTVGFAGARDSGSLTYPSLGVTALMVSVGCVFALLVINAREIVDLVKP
ncbi:MauE/DoxX family redox-associated membrane protein [Micromonospora mangrovi]|uniref:MauE/DoxX family redox-associated membrane protein n=2 Tax=Micromonospora TaxID=1873 RepID=A0AAU7M3N7_9ACTN